MTTSVDEEDLEISRLVLMRSRESKVTWSFRQSECTGVIPNVISVLLLLPKTELLASDNWRQFTVFSSEGLVMSVANPSDYTSQLGGVRVASWEVTQVVDQLLAYLQEDYKERTYGKAIKALRAL